MSKSIRKQPRKKFFRDSLEENSGHNRKGKTCDICEKRKHTTKHGELFVCSGCEKLMPERGEK